MLVNIILHLERSGYVRASTPLACASNAIAQIELPEQFRIRPITTRVEHVPTGTAFLFDHRNANAAQQRDLKFLAPDDPRESSATILRFTSGRAVVADVTVFCSDDAAHWYFPRWRKFWNLGLIDASFDLNPPPLQYYPDLPTPELQDKNDPVSSIYRATTIMEAIVDTEAAENHRAATANAMSLLPTEYSTLACESSSKSPYSDAFIFHRFGHAFNNIDERTAPIVFHKNADAFQLAFDNKGAKRGVFLFPSTNNAPHVLPSLIPQLARLWSTGFLNSP